MAVDRDLVLEMVREADLDGDGAITLQEFEVMCVHIRYPSAPLIDAFLKSRQRDLSACFISRHWHAYRVQRRQMFRLRICFR
jgi:hypothetical protein